MTRYISDRYPSSGLKLAFLNEMEESVAPTDSRRRPDQRLMENAEWDEANVEKVRPTTRQSFLSVGKPPFWAI